MTTSHPRILVTAFLSCACLSGPSVATEPPLADPTRPPEAVRGVVASAAASAVPGPTVWPRLQSVWLSTTGSSSALIDGRIVHLGERVGETTLMAIGPQSIVLRGVGFSQQVALLPGTFKTASPIGRFDQEPALPAGQRK